MREQIAWLLWCLDQGYLNEEDRALLTNWLLDPEDTLSPDDLRRKYRLLRMADEVIRAVRSQPETLAEMKSRGGLHAGDDSPWRGELTEHPSPQRSYRADPDYPGIRDAAARIAKGSEVESEWQHPQGKRITVYTDGTWSTVTRDGKRATSSATPEKLRAGYGQWKEVTT